MLDEIYSGVTIGVGEVVESPILGKCRGNIWKEGEGGKRKGREKERRKGKREARKRGKMERKRGGNCKRGGRDETKRYKNKQRTFFFFFFFTFSKPLKFVYGCTKMKISTGKKHFKPGKNREKVNFHL